MNLICKKHMVLLWCTIATMIVLVSCKDDDDFQDDDNNPPIGSNSTSIEINNALKFNSSQFKSGNAPANSNSGDLKINKDTINIWPGIQNRISILNHTNITISGVLVHIPDADGYHDVAIEAEESNDTLTVFYVDIDPDGLSLPFNNTIIISPTDGSGNVIDEFPRPIHTDTPFDPTNTNYTPSGSSCDPATGSSLYWIYTNHDGVFQNGRGFRFYQSDYTVDGCCENGASYSTCHPAPENASVDVTEQYERTELELIIFNDDGSGTFDYFLFRHYNDYWSEDTDFCSRSPGYKSRNPEIRTNGEYIVYEQNDAGDMVTIGVTSIDFTIDDLLNTGFGPITKVNEGSSNLIYHLGCRFYVETILIEGKEITRVFEIGADAALIWYD